MVRRAVRIDQGAQGVHLSDDEKARVLRSGINNREELRVHLYTTLSNTPDPRIRDLTMDIINYDEMSGCSQRSFGLAGAFQRRSRSSSCG
ncbi:hypothetical protein NDN08_002092 [Rhodosorus marinus]|uniref:Uncharacterized protein n=1 Tax=Rhodosorus marinus TaxID=101924 RepID=A0AAV8USQ3_9RHOD|nr:hypothetical protein NDN08_002092 [Rhodosorus marinus]